MEYINYQNEFDLRKHLSKEEPVLISPNTLGRMCGEYGSIPIKKPDCFYTIGLHN